MVIVQTWFMRLCTQLSASLWQRRPGAEATNPTRIEGKGRTLRNHRSTPNDSCPTRNMMLRDILY